MRIPAATNTGPALAGLFDIFVGRRLAERTAGLLHQVALDEDVDVAVEHAVDVANLLLGTVILHELVWVQDIAANLTAEGDLLLDTADLLEFGLLLLRPQIVQASLEHLHRRIPVAVLR